MPIAIRIVTELMKPPCVQVLAEILGEFWPLHRQIPLLSGIEPKIVKPYPIVPSVINDLKAVANDRVLVRERSANHHECGSRPRRVWSQQGSSLKARMCRQS